MFSDADLIHVYTRVQAIEDGQLIDVSAAARKVGIKFPVALTVAVWSQCVEVPPRRKCLEDESARLRDVLWMLMSSIRRASNTRQIEYTLRCSTRAGSRRVTLKAMCGPGDDAEPVITVMQPGED